MDYKTHIKKAKDWGNGLRSSLVSFNSFSKKSNNIILVTYEDLCSSLNKEIKRITKFLNIEMEKCLYVPSVLGCKWEGSGSVREMKNIGRVILVNKKINHPYTSLITYILYRRINDMLVNNNKLRKFHITIRFPIKYRLYELFPRLFLNNNE